MATIVHYDAMYRLLIPICVLLLATSPAEGQRLGVVTGYEGGDRIGYIYGTASMVMPVGANLDLVPHLTLSYLFYSYEVPGGTVSVRSPGLAVGTGLRVHAPGIAVTVGPAIEARRTTRIEPGERSTQTVAGLLLFGDLWARLAPQTTLTIGSSYSFVNDFGRTSGTVIHQLTSVDTGMALSAGAEAMVFGTPEAYAYGGGGLLGVRLAGQPLSLQLRAGYLFYVAGNVHEGQPYYGVGFVTAF